MPQATDLHGAHGHDFAITQDGLGRPVRAYCDCGQSWPIGEPATAAEAMSAAEDPPGTIRDTGNATILDEDQPEAHVNRYFIKWAPAYDTDETHPWVALNHEAGLQRMPNDLMDRYPIAPADVVQQRLSITRA